MAVLFKMKCSTIRRMYFLKLLVGLEDKFMGYSAHLNVNKREYGCKDPRH
jgi:hypothetical protein